MQTDPLFVSTPIIGLGSAYMTNPVLGTLAPMAFTWGLNALGRLGDNTAIDKHTPVFVSGSIPFSFFATAGFGGIAIRQSNGTTWAWGNNASGEIGDNSATNRSSPVSVVGGHSFLLVGGGSYNSIGVKSDGTAWCWGYGTGGRNGDNSTTSRSSPVSVVGAHSFLKATINKFCATGLKFDGTVWAWGYNTSRGQVGDNTATNRSSPVSIVGAHVFMDVLTGGQVSIGLKFDGSAWCWGGNANGNCGDNTTTDRSSPVSVVGGHLFSKISVGYTSCFGIKSDGSTWAWGGNGNGQLGDNTATSRSSPVSVAGNHSFTSIMAMNAAWGIKSSDGSVWGWGKNTYGQVGDTTSLQRSSPVSVVTPIKFITLSPSSPGSFNVAGGLGIGPMALLMTAGANGSRIEYITIKATVTTTAGVIRFWIDNGNLTSIQLFKEVLVAAFTPSGTVLSGERNILFGSTIPPNSRLWASTEKGENYNFIVNGGNL